MLAPREHRHPNRDIRVIRMCFISSLLITFDVSNIVMLAEMLTRPLNVRRWFLFLEK